MQPSFQNGLKHWVFVERGQPLSHSRCCFFASAWKASNSTFRFRFIDRLDVREMFIAGMLVRFAIVAKKKEPEAQALRAHEFMQQNVANLLVICIQRLQHLDQIGIRIDTHLLVNTATMRVPGFRTDV